MKDGFWHRGRTIILPLELIILPEGLLFRAPFSEPYMLGYVAPYMEPSVSTSTNMEAAFGRLHNSGAGAFGARPTVVESIVVDGEIDGSMYGATYPSIYGSENGARNNNPSGRIINSGGRIIVRPLVYILECRLVEILDSSVKSVPYGDYHLWIVRRIQ